MKVRRGCFRIWAFVILRLRLIGSTLLTLTVICGKAIHISIRSYKYGALSHRLLPRSSRRSLASATHLPPPRHPFSRLLARARNASEAVSVKAPLSLTVSRPTSNGHLDLHISG
ncbi:hypothetical protein E2C01_036043 [Portunus trituberculatus]|uniref:Uncharacterized protein n=1 Tax=Portunus trituberculatus TaxID=210409 RepID=A0A5B7F7L8_PORTR|nr:hypothetical protein [Portunus trituberculatus]